MKLRRLALQGYKTFASKTEFVFDSGITAIVGPNGSGKSNIADAMRWVLGEQSYGALRARRSADMIFSGSNGRARAGMAQATITLDNSDGWLPIDFTEVEIARRSFRSGENEYLINGRNVRLKDVAELLATSGLGERTYTIIGQGLVDQALSLRSDERRALFEEAAGITHYKARRAETLRRLDETQRNLQRVIDILDELRPRVANLRRQATRTRNYEQISTDLHELLLTWYGYRWEQLKRELHSARQAATQAELAWSVARNKLLAHQEQIDAVQVELANAQQQTATLQSDRDRIRQEAERARRSLAIQRERHKAYERQIAEIETELPPLEQTATKAQMEVDQAMADLAEAQAALQAQQTALQEYRSASASHRTQITHWQREVLRHETERQQSRTALAQAEGQLSQLRERRAELGDVEQPDADAAGAGQDIRRLEEQVAAARAESTRLQAARSDESGARAAEISRIKEMRRSAKEAEQSLNRLRHDLARQEERAAQLDRRGQRAISLKSDGVRGRLASHLQVPNDHQTAVLSALGDRLAAWLVDDSESLWQIVDRLQSDKVEDEERHLLASLDGSDPTKQQRPQVSGENGVIGWADGLVSADDRVAPLVGRLLGSVLLVKDAASAYRLAVRWPAGFSAVAPDGLVVHGGGVVEVGGASRNDILSLEDRRREIAGRLDEMRAVLAASETSHGVQLSAIDSLQERVDGRAAEEQRLTGLEAEAARQLAQAQSQLDRARQEREFAARRRESRANERHQVLERIRQNEDAISRFTGLIAEHQSLLDQANEQLATLPVGEAEQQRQSLHQSVAAAQTILAGRQAVVDSRRATFNQAEDQLARLRYRLSQLQTQLLELGQEEHEAESNVLEQELAAVDSALQPLVTQTESGRVTLSRLQADSTGLQRQAHDLESQMAQARIHLTQKENQIEGLEERIHADLGLVALSFDSEQTGATPLPIHELVERLPSVDELPPDIEANIQQYRGQLHRMGPINPEAPAELAVTEERVEFLTLQVNDLSETDEQLRGVIAELDELTSRAFAKTVEQVNGIFDDTFKQLFGGGSGRLAMTDPDDPTSSGVEIIARLPNRREQGLALLSGGERSLTAAALIFSLLKVAPPPFCVLDEVDAALDEANVNRFREVLRELGQNTQFILITHNRGTVQAAQTLYGVSMQPDSSSQVISIKPEEYAQHA